MKLKIDLDYYIEDNRIEVYGSNNWLADNQEDYDRQETLINTYRVSNDLFDLECWCDISGFDYWYRLQHETNYLSITVIVKKDILYLSPDEIRVIEDAIMECQTYFDGVLEDFTHKLLN